MADGNEICHATDGFLETIHSNGISIETNSYDDSNFNFTFVIRIGILFACCFATLCIIHVTLFRSGKDISPKDTTNFIQKMADIPLSRDKNANITNVVFDVLQHPQNKGKSIIIISRFCSLRIFITQSITS